MVVADNTQGANASFDQELGKYTLDLSLARLEIVTADEGLVLLSKLDAPRDKGVLRCSVDERNAFEDATNCKDGGRSNFGMVLFDALQEIVGRIVNTRDDISIALGVGGPDDDDLIQSVFILEGPDVVANVLDVGPLFVSGDQIVGTAELIGGNEGRVVDGGKWLILAEMLDDLTLKIPVEDFGTCHSRGQVKGTDIPSTEDEIIGMHHGKDRIDGGVDIIALGINPKFHGRRLSDAPVIIRLNHSIFIAEADIVTVGSDCGSQSTTVVTAPTDHHKTVRNELVTIHLVGGTGLPDARNNGVGFKLVMSLCGLDDKFAGLLGDEGIFVDILGKNVIIVISDVIGNDLDSGGCKGDGDGRRFVSPGVGVINGKGRHTGWTERR